MQRVISFGMVCFGLVAFAFAGSAATLYPYLIPVRTEITNRLAFLTDTNNAVEGRVSQIRQLNQALNFLQRRGRATLQSDLQKLATISALLSRNANSNAFEPLLLVAVQNYTEVLTESADSLNTSLSALPPSRDVDAALNALDVANDTLDQVRASSDPVLAARLLSRASIRLLALQAALPRLSRPGNTEPPAGSGLHASINGESFTADTALFVNFSPGTGVLTIRGTQNLGTETRSLSLTISGVRDRLTTVEQLGNVGRGSHAIYSRTGTNTVSYISTSGSAIVTLDLSTRTVTGTFSFTGAGSFSLAPPVQVSGGAFTATVR